MGFKLEGVNSADRETTHQVELKGQTCTSGKESFDSTNIRHKVKSKYENEESNGGSNETRSEQI